MMRTISRWFMLSLLLCIGSYTYAQEGAYVNSVTVAAGDTLKFYINSSSTTFTLKISRFLNSATTQTILSFNNIAGGLRVVPADAYLNGCGWPESFRMIIPQNWEPGIYRATFPTSAGGGGVLFFVKPQSPGSFSKTLLVLNTNTWQAYNTYGGKSLYPQNNIPRSYKVSYMRPSTHNYGAYFFFQQEVKFVDWLYADGKKPEYLTDVDIHSNPSILSGYDVVVIAGHGEYWSLQERNAFQQYVNNGGKLMILGGNTCWWQSRLEDNGNTLVCYKDRTLDPLTGISDSLVTVNWYDRPVYNPENSTTGLSFRSSGYVNNNSTLPASSGYGDYAALNTHHWIYRNTGLKDADEYGYNEQIVGNETDGSLYAWNNGLPVITGTDGTPATFRILGISPSLSNNGVPGHAVPGIYYNSHGGVVFNAASIKWVNGLATNEAVKTITSNIYKRFLDNKFPPDIISWLPYKTDTLVVNNENLFVNRREITLDEGSAVNFTINAVDPENEQISYKWYVNDNTVNNTSSFDFTAGKDSIYNVKGTVSNQEDSTYISWIVHVKNSIVSIPVVPVLVFPGDNSLLDSANVVFKWDTAAGTRIYNLLVASDSLFSSLIFNDSTNADSFNVSLSGKGSLFFWKVRAGNEAGYSEYSAYRKFSIKLYPVLPDVPQLISPSENAELTNTTVEFVWDSAGNAERYNIQAASDSDFSSLLLNDTLTLKSDLYNFNQSGKYFWRVRGLNTAGSGNYSSIRSFTVISAPAAPGLISPSANANLTNPIVQFAWDSTSSVQYYIFQASDDSIFSSPAVNDTIYKTNFSYDFTSKGYSFYWRVRGFNNAGAGNYSQVRHFTIALAPLTPGLISPADNASFTNPDIAFQWDSLSSVQFYVFETAADSAFKSLVVNDTVFNNKYSYNFTGKGTSFYWRVRGFNSTGGGSYSLSRHFSIIISPGVPGLISPSNNAALTNPKINFQWDSVATAAFYILQLSPDSVYTTLVVKDTIYTNKYIYDLTGKGSLFYWRVKAGNTAGVSAFSNSRKFSITTPAPGPVTLIYPLKNQKNVPLNVTFTWNKSSNSAAFTFLLSTDKLFKAIVVIDTSLKSTDTLRIVNGLVQKKNYWWKITAKNSSGSTDSEVRQFTTGTTSGTAGTITSVYALRLNSDDLRITWSGGNDIDHYEVEKKSSADSWEGIEEIPSGSGSSGTYHYDYKDDGKSVSRFRIASYYVDGTVELSDEISSDMVLKEYVLRQNYPNPFNPVTNIEFFLPDKADVILEIYALTGELIKRLAEGTLDAGYYRYSFDASGLSSGVYFYALRSISSDGAHNFNSVKKMILLK